MSTPESATLDAVKVLAIGHRQSAAARDAAVRAALADGHTLRAVAEAAGLSPAGIARIRDRG